jgi:hypothetical protein
MNEAIYINALERIGDYEGFFKTFVKEQGMLPEAFEEIKKGIEASHNIKAVATAIISGVFGIGIVLIAMLAHSFIHKNEKSLCVLRAFGLSWRKIAAMVTVQMMLIWCLALALVCPVLILAGPAVLSYGAKTIKIPHDALAASFGQWPLVAVVFTIVIVIISLMTVGYWWRSTRWVGTRLKEID